MIQEEVRAEAQLESMRRLAAEKSAEIARLQKREQHLLEANNC